ncbi:MAG: transcriptional repressor [Clostridiales bacterium]|nr:transcriptional repressor [Clostridiales bacterium]
MTKNAEYILEIINTADEHLTAEQIYLRLKEKNAKAVLATVYNNLSSLYEQGMIRKVSVEGFPDRYDKVKRHDHLVCRKCGKLSDIMLENLTKRLQKEVPVPILSYDLKINYICKECLEKENEKGGNKK